MGSAAHLLGIKARDWDDYTVEEEDHYLDWVEDYLEQMAKARDGGRS